MSGSAAKAIATPPAAAVSRCRCQPPSQWRRQFMISSAACLFLLILRWGGEGVLTGFSLAAVASTMTTWVPRQQQPQQQHQQQHRSCPRIETIINKRLGWGDIVTYLEYFGTYLRYFSTNPTSQNCETLQLIPVISVTFQLIPRSHFWHSTSSSIAESVSSCPVLPRNY